jgi:hypothetical protein
VEIGLAQVHTHVPMATKCTWILVALALAAAGCGGGDGDGGETTGAGGGTETSTEPAEPITIDLAESNGSGQSGTAELQPGQVGSIATFDVTLEIAPTLEAPQMAHVHRVSCAEYAEIADFDKQLATVHAPLTDVRDGSSQTGNVSGSIGKGGFSINVHEPDPPFAAVACGDIPAS